MSKREAVEILLVEDDPNDVELALIALRKSHLPENIQIARDGEEALDFLFGRGPYSDRPLTPPKLVLLDLKLPKVTGLEVLKEMKSHPRTRPIPVAVLTSSKEQRDMIDCYELGANSYIQKPIHFEHFERAIHDVGYYWLTVNQNLPPDAFPK
jgi:two-component system response regulator